MATQHRILNYLVIKAECWLYIREMRTHKAGHARERLGRSSCCQTRL